MSSSLWASAFAAGFGALLGSISAFLFERWWGHRREHRTRLSAAHEATFAIICAIDALQDYQNRAINPHIENPAAWLLPPKTFVPPKEDSFTKGLEFLLPDDGKLLHELALESRRYEAARITIENYVSFSVETLQPAIEQTGLQKTNLAEIENALGPRISGTAENNWKAVCEQVGETCESLPKSLERLRKALAREFPNKDLLTIKSNADGK